MTEYFLLGLTFVTSSFVYASYKGWFSSAKTAVCTLGIRGTIELVMTLVRMRILKKLGVGVLENSEGGLFKVCYYDGAKKCTILLKKERGPSKITKVVEGVKDVTEEIVTYTGPSRNFYGTPITPKHLGKKELSFHYRSGEVRSFNHDQTINLV